MIWWCIGLMPICILNDYAFEYPLSDGWIWNHYCILLPTHCLLIPMHPKGFVIVIIPSTISIKIFPDRYLREQVGSFFCKERHLLYFKGRKNRGLKRRGVLLGRDLGFVWHWLVRYRAAQWTLGHGFNEYRLQPSHNEVWIYSTSSISDTVTFIRSAEENNDWD